MLQMLYLNVWHSWLDAEIIAWCMKKSSLLKDDQVN